MNRRLWLSLTCRGDVIHVRHKHPCQIHVFCPLMSSDMEVSYVLAALPLSGDLTCYFCTCPPPMNCSNLPPFPISQSKYAEFKMITLAWAAVYLQPGLCKYTVALFLPPATRPPTSNNLNTQHVSLLVGSIQGQRLQRRGRERRCKRRLMFDRARKRRAVPVALLVQTKPNARQ